MLMKTGKMYEMSEKSFLDKPVGNWISISVPSPDFVAMATRVGPTTFCTVSLNQRSTKNLWYVRTSAAYLPYGPSY